MSESVTDKHPVTLQQLSGVPETLLITLTAKAQEALHPKGIFRDQRVLELWERLGDQLQNIRAGWMTQVGVATRTIVFDDLVREYLTANPSATIVNLAAGLDTRYWRLDNGQLRWFDIDLPEVAHLRRSLFPETERLQVIGESVTNSGWMDQLGSPEKLLVIMEGLSMYLPNDAMKQLLAGIAARYPGSTIIFDAVTPGMLRGASRFESFRKYRDVWNFAVMNGQEVARWSEEYQLKEERCLYDYYPRRWRWISLLMRFPRIRRAMRPFVLQLQLGQAS